MRTRGKRALAVAKIRGACGGVVMRSIVGHIVGHIVVLGHVGIGLGPRLTRTSSDTLFLPILD